MSGAVSRNQGVPGSGRRTHVTLLRHGETDWNDSGRYQGHLDIPLNQTGMAQAEMVAKALAVEDFTAIYTSDLLRARYVAEAVGKTTGRPVQSDPGLRERDMGAYQGLTHREIISRHDLKPGADHRTFMEIPGGESAAVFLERVVGTVERLTRAHPGGHVLLVTHGGFIHYFLRWALGLPVTAPVRLKIANTSLHRLDRDDEGWAMVAMGLVGHLGTADVAEKA